MSSWPWLRAATLVAVGALTPGPLVAQGVTTSPFEDGRSRIAGAVIPGTAEPAPPEAPGDDGARRRGDVPRPPRLSLSLAWGRVSGGPSAAIAGAMRAAGLDETSEAECLLFFCTDATPHPVSEGGSAGEMLAVDYAVSMLPGELHPALGVRLIRATTALATTTGHRSGHDVSLKQSATVTALLVTARVGGLRVGAGPSLATVHVGEGSDGPPALRARRHGLVLEAAIALPTSFFVELGAQKRILPAVSMDPYGALPRTRLPFSHTVLTLGIGARF